MNLFYICPLIIICTVAQNSICSYGWFEENNGECMFNCNYEDDFVEPSTLSFSFIRSTCSNVEDAYQQGICDSIDDLVYRADYCTCPYCKCSTSSSELVEVFNLNNPDKTCSNCTCSDAPYDSYGIDDKIYQCTQLISVDSPYEWDLYACPPNECIEITSWGDEYIHYAGDEWWNDVDDSNTSCTEFCYCPANGEAICETGYQAILSTYPALKNQFIEDCASTYGSGAVKLFV